VEEAERVARGGVAPAAGQRAQADGHLLERSVEVGPPQRGRQQDAERGRGKRAGVQVDVFGPHPYRHDRLAQGDDHGQAVALGEVPGREAPALDAALEARV
jgi:hypothetical protein